MGRQTDQDQSPSGHSEKTNEVTARSTESRWTEAGSAGLCGVKRWLRG